MIVSDTRHMPACDHAHIGCSHLDEARCYRVVLASPPVFKGQPYTD